ncbi:MAG: hypothetical protein V4591_01550 [Bdellovibrionota bacterium]
MGDFNSALSSSNVVVKQKFLIPKIATEHKKEDDKGQFGFKTLEEKENQTQSEPKKEKRNPLSVIKNFFINEQACEHTCSTKF